MFKENQRERLEGFLHGGDLKLTNFLKELEGFLHRGDASLRQKVFKRAY